MDGVHAAVMGHKVTFLARKRRGCRLTPSTRAAAAFRRQTFSAEFTSWAAVICLFLSGLDSRLIFFFASFSTYKSLILPRTLQWNCDLLPGRDQS